MALVFEVHYWNPTNAGPKFKGLPHAKRLQTTLT